MVWFKVDDTFAKSRKVLAIPKHRRAAAIGVWTLAGTWAAGELTDGFIPEYALEEIPGGKKFGHDLILCGLWHQVDGGFQFHDWDHYQRAREAVIQERSDHAARQKAYRDKLKAKRDAARDASLGISRDVSRDGTVTAPRPDPTRPDPTVVPTELLIEPSPTEKVPRATRLPKDWEPSPKMIAWVKENCPGIDGRTQTIRFQNHWIAKPGKDATKLDWDRTYQNWMLDARPNWGPSPPANVARISTGQQRATTAMDLAQKFAAEENETSDHRQIGTA